MLLNLFGVGIVFCLASNGKERLKVENIITLVVLYDLNTPKMFEVSMQPIKYKADNFLLFYLMYQHGVHGLQEELQTHKSQNDLGV